MVNATPHDILAFSVFLICSVGYSLIASHLTRRRLSTVAAITLFRHRWAKRMMDRENHIADAALLGNLLRGALFFSSTTVFILGGLVAVLGTTTKIDDIASHFPFAVRPAPGLAEIKALIVILVYVYAFFKFTWAAWQYNILSIILGAMPERGSDIKTREEYGDVAAHILSLAGESHNKGVRAFYLSIPLMAWFIHPLLFLAATLAITFVIFQREFSSPVLHVLRASRI
jgi:uncharacterized membrane protein